jgi:4'-phosphopantetheinyl transferase
MIVRTDPLMRSDFERLITLLTPQERHRLHQYRRSEDQERFLLGRGGVRCLLGELLDEDPARLRFGSGPHGKPFLLPPCVGSKGSALPRFNVSHSGDLILIAVHPHSQVGVDVEQLRPGLDWLPIARRCFPPGVVASIEALPPQRRALAFLEHWCRLEAGLKARGSGFCRLDPAERISSEQRYLHHLPVDVPEGYVGSVAVLLADQPGTRA